MYVYVILAIVCYAIESILEHIWLAKRIKFSLSVLIISLILSTVAGMRDTSVGTDTYFYGLRAYNACISLPLDTFFLSSDFSRWAPLVKLACWFGSNWGKSLFWMLFVLQVCSAVPTLIAIKTTLAKDASFGILIYIIIFYPITLNIMRQAIAMGFILLAFSLLNGRHHIASSIAFVVGVLFHNSAIIGIMIYLIYYIANIESISNGIKLTVCAALGIAGLIIFILFGNSLASLVGYESYVSGSNRIEGGGSLTVFGIVSLFITLGLLAYLFRSSKINYTDTSLYSQSLLLTELGIIFFAMSLISFWLHRIGLYYLQFCVLLIPFVGSRIDDRKTAVFYKVFACIAIIILMYIYYEISGSNEVVPYVVSSLIYK